MQKCEVWTIKIKPISCPVEDLIEWAMSKYLNKQTNKQINNFCCTWWKYPEKINMVCKLIRCLLSEFFNHLLMWIIKDSEHQSIAEPQDKSGLMFFMSEIEAFLFSMNILPVSDSKIPLCFWTENIGAQIREFVRYKAGG